MRRPSQNVAAMARTRQATLSSSARRSRLISAPAMLCRQVGPDDPGLVAEAHDLARTARPSRSPAAFTRRTSPRSPSPSTSSGLVAARPHRRQHGVAGLGQQRQRMARARPAWCPARAAPRPDRGPAGRRPAGRSPRRPRPRAAPWYRASRQRTARPEACHRFSIGRWALITVLRSSSLQAGAPQATRGCPARAGPCSRMPARLRPVLGWLGTLVAQVAVGLELRRDEHHAHDLRGGGQDAVQGATPVSRVLEVDLHRRPISAAMTASCASTGLSKISTRSSACREAGWCGPPAAGGCWRCRRRRRGPARCQRQQQHQAEGHRQRHAERQPGARQAAAPRPSAAAGRRSRHARGTALGRSRGAEARACQTLKRKWQTSPSWTT